MEKHTPSLEEIRRDIDVGRIAAGNDGTQTLFADILDWCRDRYGLPKTTFWNTAQTLAEEYERSLRTSAAADRRIDIGALSPFLGEDSFYRRPFLNGKDVCVTEGHFLLGVDKGLLTGEIPTEQHRIPPYTENAGSALTADTLREFIGSLPKVEEVRELEAEEICPECHGKGEVEFEHRSSVTGETYYTADTCPVCDGTGVHDNVESRRTGRMVPDRDTMLRIVTKRGDETVSTVFRLEPFSLILKAMELLSLEEVRIISHAADRPMVVRSTDGNVTMMLMPCSCNKEVKYQLTV